jgi:hypothetical protein
MARTVKPKSGVIRKVISLKVTLRDTKPPVWRRLLAPGETTLGDLHGAIQAAMGWEDCHLHSFDIEGRQYGNPRSVGDVADEERVTLKDLITSGVARFAYTYDFGDNWEHALVVEKRLPDIEALSRPICTAGKRRCPPEDCGSPWGYRKLLEILAILLIQSTPSGVSGWVKTSIPTTSIPKSQTQLSPPASAAPDRHTSVTPFPLVASGSST